GRRHRRHPPSAGADRQPLQRPQCAELCRQARRWPGEPGPVPRPRGRWRTSQPHQCHAHCDQDRGLARAGARRPASRPAAACAVVLAGRIPA
ncbi:hypothetical protein CSC81_18470, partial [Tenacibaculum discolor]